jgi:hypothetical protein
VETARKEAVNQAFYVTIHYGGMILNLENSELLAHKLFVPFAQLIYQQVDTFNHINYSGALFHFQIPPFTIPASTTDSIVP